MSAADLIKKSQTIVIKIGSVLLADKDGTIKQGWLDAMAQDIQALIKQKKKIVVVSSGAIALGRRELGIAANVAPASIRLEQKQAASAVGQFHLFHGWHDAFSKLGLTTAQILLTMSETENRRMHLNARETIYTLLDKGIVPVINENDTISTGEIRFGDNDRLAVRVAQMIEADAVLLLSTIDGLYTADPSIDPKATHIPVIEKITDEHVAIAGEAVAGLSTGGMRSKLQAAIAATRAGIALVITKGTDLNPLKLLESGKLLYTVFPAQETKAGARKRWIQTHIKPRGAIIIDDGAVKALSDGRSLLPIGVKNIEGEFARGDAVSIKTISGTVMGIGLCAYSTEDAKKIIGKQSKEISALLGYAGRDELIHRNDMVLT
jgi:glutamate 5-kinase